MYFCGAFALGIGFARLVPVRSAVAIDAAGDS
jgi:hypothetical protein